MFKKIMFIGIIMFLIACSSKESQEENTDIEDSSDFKVVEQDQSFLEIDKIIDQHSEALVMEYHILHGNAFQDGMRLKDLEEFLLLHYTEEITNETINLILYKSSQYNGQEYPIYTYNENSEIFELIDEEYNDEIATDPVFSIVEILEKTDDRIVVMVDIQFNVSRKEYPEGKVKIVLEKEGYDWYFGDLIYPGSRRLINQANLECSER